MGAAAAGFALITGLASNIAGNVLDIWGGVRADERAEDAIGLQKAQLNLDRQRSYQETLGQIYGVEQDITNLEIERSQLGVDIRETEFQIGSYQEWLEYYPKQKELQTTAFEYEGRQAFEGLMNSLGYADALAGATGRAAPGTSMAAVAGKAKQDVVNYFGGDMRQDAEGGLYGMQYNDMLHTLEQQFSQQSQQLDIFKESLIGLQESEVSMGESIERSKDEKGRLQEWVDLQFGDLQKDLEYKRASERLGMTYQEYLKKHNLEAGEEAEKKYFEEGRSKEYLVGGK
jgi:hypothetical protein